MIYYQHTNVKLCLIVVLVLALMFTPFSGSYGIDVKDNLKDALFLPYEFEWPIYELKPIWFSSMAQAKSLPLLFNAYNLTGNDKYKETADGILKSFFVPVENGGITYKTNESGWWYELYAGKEAKHPKVLNGMLWTLMGLYEYYQLSHNKEAKFLFDQGILSLKENLHQYDDNGYSYYDALKTTNKLEYHLIHIGLLDSLSSITGDNTLKFYHQKWSKANLTNTIRQETANIQLDKTYVPYVDYGNLSGIHIGIQRNPVTVDHIALEYYNRYKEFNDPFYKNAFLNNVDWLVNNAIKINFTH